MNTPPLRFPPLLRGREVGGVEMVLLDANVAGFVESWLGSPAPLSGQRRERLEQLTAHFFGRLALRVGNGLDPVADLLR